MTARDYDTAKSAAGPCRVEKGDAAMLGGFIAVVESRRITIDETYRQKMEEERENFKGISI